MGIWNNLFGKSEETKQDPEIIGAEKFETGEVVINFSYANYPNDYFAVEVLKDEFNNQITLQPYWIHSRRHDKVLLFAKGDTILCLGLRKIGSGYFLTLEAYRKEIQFNVGDQFLLKFESESVCKFNIEVKGKRHDKDSDGVRVECLIPIGREQIIKLFDENLIKWQYIKVAEGKQYTGYTNQENIRNIKEMADMMQNAEMVRLKGL